MIGVKRVALELLKGRLIRCISTNCHKTEKLQIIYKSNTLTSYASVKFQAYVHDERTYNL